MLSEDVYKRQQLTQRAGNFLVAREEIPDFHWTDLKDKKVLGGRKGGMPEMVFEYILRQNGIDPSKDLIIDPVSYTHLFNRLDIIYFVICQN